MSNKQERNASYFDMTPQEEADYNVKTAAKLRRSEDAWKELCLYSQRHDPKTGFYLPVDNYHVLDIFNRMKLDFLKIDGKN